MPFLRNAWYCVGHAAEFETESTKTLLVLGEPLFLFRNRDKTMTALLDRCPHRFAPLSLGKIVDGQVECPYHGLRFDSSGRCTLNPHGDQSIPKAARVRSFPVLERHGFVWVWMGNPEQADPAVLPDLHLIEERAGWTRVNGYLRTASNYQLVIDNLLDLTHARYLHPFLTGADAQRPPDRVESRLEQHGNAIVAVLQTYGDWSSPLVHLMWGSDKVPERVDSRNNMRWQAPAHMLLDSGFFPAGGSPDDGPCFPSAHLLTPETETTTHYFFATTRNTHVGSAEVSQALLQAATNAFGNEDAPMIHACQRNMGTTDLMSLGPLLLQTDASAIRARRLLDALVEAEAGAA